MHKIIQNSRYTMLNWSNFVTVYVMFASKNVHQNSMYAWLRMLTIEIKKQFEF